MNIVREMEKLLADGGFYMYPIFLLSVAMFGLILHHGLRYRDLKRAMALSRRGHETGAAADSALLEMVEQYRHSRCSTLELNVRLREEIVRNFLTRMGAGGRSIILCGSIAMLLGLLGTVSGMINTFEAIQLFGVGNTKSFAAGIAEALLTTQSGLLVGVVGLAAGHLLRRMHTKLRMRLYRYLDRIESGAVAPGGGVRG